MRIHDGQALIGREHPAELLRAEISRVTASHGGLVLVTGEAGIGKTTLVTSAAEQARREGAVVLSGSCWDSEAAPGYWPWVQVIRALRRTGEWPAVEEAAGGSLAALLGDGVRAEVGDAFQVYDAVTTALVTLSQTRPVVVVLDDLHWADGASLRLLEFAAQHTWFERLLLLGTYRDVEVEQGEHPLRPQLTSLSARATMITLTGLDRAQVAALITRTIGHEPDDDVVEEIYLRTGGNPFFVEQTARLWRSNGSVAAIPPGVRDTLWRRLSLLPTTVVTLLTDAAVLGREFHRQVLAAVAAAPAAHVDRLLAQAAAARLVVSRGGGVFAFAHDLVRETLHDSVDEADLRARHAATVHALRGRAEVLPGDLARHAYLAGDALDPVLACELLVAAAKQALHRLAREESLTHWGRAMELAEKGPPEQVIKIGLAFGRELHHGGELKESARVFDRAITAARRLDDPGLLARAALTYYGTCGNEDARTSLALLRDAHATFVPDPAPDPDDADRLAQDLAVRITFVARNSDDDEALTFGLWALHDTIWGPGTAKQRVELTEELRALARRGNDVEMEHFTTALHWVALLELGDPRFLDQFHHYIAMGRRSDRAHVGLSTSIDLSIIELLSGNFAAAESLLEEVVEVSSDHDHAHFGYMLDHHRWALLLAQGRFEELRPLHERLRAGRHPYASMLEGLTDLRRGRAVTAWPRAGDEPSDGSIRPLWLRYLAEVAAASRDPELCARARELLEPHLSEWAVSLYGWDVSGPMILWQGLVEAAEERWDAAISAFTAATRSADQLHARLWSVEARLHLGAALLARAHPGDVETADRLLNDLAAEAATLDMRHIPDRLDRVRQASRDRTAGPAVGTERQANNAQPSEPGDLRAHRPGPTPAMEPGPLRVHRRGTTEAMTPGERPADQPGDGRPIEPEERQAVQPDGALPREPEERRAVQPGDARGVEPDEGRGRSMDGDPSAPVVGQVEADRLHTRKPGSGPAPREDGQQTRGLGREQKAADGQPAASSDGAHGLAGSGVAVSGADGRKAFARLGVVGPGHVFTRQGSVWSLSFGGRTVHVPDAKGLRDLHHLLSRPGTDLPAVHLLAPEGGEVVVAARQMGGDAMLDEEAKARFRRDLARLDEETDRALELGDDERAAALDREREALLAELRAAAGLGGRARRLGDEAERARKTVTARIRDVLRKLDTLHPELAAHLRAAVSTGTTCRYDPGHDITWRL
ncbi:AAA family ATPase [Nonomuraea sp. NPDC049152]|uniref:ATP-binding protein n=1 Tax=Nonomuraea sp. NPDC049152 TaxID=3154350 RepID=UPI0033C8134F